MELPVYIPNAKVCHMTQYKCCKYHTRCRLYPVCSKMDISINNDICKRDCPSCDYIGCSLPLEQRQTHPIYINSFIQGERKELNLETRRWREKDEYKKKHRTLYFLYNSLFGDLQERWRERSRQYRQNNRDKILAYQRKWRAAHRSEKTETILPECKFDCFNCPHEDCVLPDDWKEKALDKKYYEQNKSAIAQRRKAHRQKPEIKAARYEYDKRYRKEHPENVRKKQKKYRDLHPEKVREMKRAQWEKHKDEWNALRRRKHHHKKKIMNGEIERMAIQPGSYTEVTVKNTNIEELQPFAEIHGVLHVYQNNYIVFECNQTRVPLLVNLSLGDFSVPSSDELWIRCDAGEATFRRPYGNPLWECEKS